MKKKVGIIGDTGRMGDILKQQIFNHSDFILSVGFNKSQNTTTLADVFKKSDYVVDFSNSSIIKDILIVANSIPKPLIICTTGWAKEDFNQLLQNLATKTIVVISPNNSMGSFLQKQFAHQLAKILDGSYDINITEKHHRNKIDSPSGTAISLINEIKESKKKYHHTKYNTFYTDEGPRPNNCIKISTERSGNLAGTHNIDFISNEEMICINHVVFDRVVFAKGAIKILEILVKKSPKPKIYYIEDILNL